DLAPDVCAALEDHDDSFAIAILDQLRGIGRAEHARPAGREAKALRVVGDLGRGVVVVHRLRPRQERNLLDADELLAEVGDPGLIPDTVPAEIYGAVREARRRRGGIVRFLRLTALRGSRQ